MGNRRRLGVEALLWRLVTNLGRVEISFAKPGTGHHDELVDRAKKFPVFGVQVSAASVDDLVKPLDITGSLRNTGCAAQIGAIQQSASLVGTWLARR